MFRDTYKKAVDDIKPDENALNKTLSYIEEQQDRKKTIHFPTRSLAPLVACAMIAFLGIRVYNNNTLQTDSPIISQKIDDEESTTHNTPTMNNLSQAHTRKTQSEKTNKTADTNQISTIEIDGYKHSDAESIAGNTDEITNPNARLIGPQTPEDNNKNDNINTPEIITDNIQIFTYNEYCKYIGFDIKETIDAPKDMIFVDNNEIEVLNNIAKFQWQGNESRKITIYISNTENTINSIEQAPYNEQCIDKIVLKNNTNCYIQSENLTQEEFDKIINSIEHDK